MRKTQEASSAWYPFRSRYGVSGHAYQGAFPWLVFARYIPVTTAKPILHLFSTFAGLSRLQTDSHYPSQIFLGWAYAYEIANHNGFVGSSKPILHTSTQQPSLSNSIRY